MEPWGSWSFSNENANLLDEVLDKFATDRSGQLDASRTRILSSLIASSKKHVEMSSSSGGDDDDDIDIEGDFRACFPKCRAVGNDERATDAGQDPRGVPTAGQDPRGVPTAGQDPRRVPMAVPDPFDGLELSFQSQLPAAVDRVENVAKLVVELLNAGDFDARELCSLLRTEMESRPNVTEIIQEVWPEIVTDEARHGLCEALVETDVKPQVVFAQIYLPWFETCESNLTGFIESLSKMIVHFPEYACKYFLVDLLKDKNSILVKHVDWLSEIMKSIHQRNWCILLSEYMKYCDRLDQHQILVLLHLIKNCPKCLDSNITERLVALCLNAVHKHSTNRDFAVFLMSVIEVIDLVKFRPEITSICGVLKGASKFLIMKALKDAK